jgi:hypothetical protein
VSLKTAHLVVRVHGRSDVVPGLAPPSPSPRYLLLLAVRRSATAAAYTCLGVIKRQSPDILQLADPNHGALEFTVRQARAELASYRSPIGIEFPSRRLAGRWAGAVDGPTVRRGQQNRSRANHDFNLHILSVATSCYSFFILTNV